MTARHGRPGPDPCQSDHSRRSSKEDSLPVVCSVIREAWEDVGTARRVPRGELQAEGIFFCSRGAK